jgi:hypothetical protein
MAEDERIWEVKQLLFDFVKSPSPRHTRDAHSRVNPNKSAGFGKTLSCIS